MYTKATTIECINRTYNHHYPGIFTLNDIKIAEVINRHVLLTAKQAKYFGLARRRLGHLVKYGFLYRYLVKSGEEELGSVYAIGPAAKYYQGYPIVGISNPHKVQSMVAVNQVLIYLLNHSPQAEVTVMYQKPMQAVFSMNKPVGITAPRTGFDPSIIGLDNIEQAIVILPNKNQAQPGLPVRYVFDEDLDDPFNIQFYAYRTDKGLEKVDLF